MTPNVQPFCEPALIPSTPNVSVGMEAFNDTPIVNGTAYPTTTVDPKAYRYRILNAANDRFWNLSWYVADPTTGTLSEVALKPTEVAAAQTDPVVFPTPDDDIEPEGPELDPDRHRGRLPAHPGRRPGRSRPPGSPIRPASTSATSTSTRCCWHRPSEPT